ncbi:alcohol dehydrogenase catalytic domain-containing protein [Burkholderia cenocepacia]|uniref:alcohol dehydrogenase catalytic domain-containing protein n=1 Tax=Burkholderia cenocepacia TaxID=95486 RepID=UPI00201226AB|nr:alcohol dehydrogenase catalytic domain-containing protein [Burkholderia cenocepacia]
MKVNTFKFPELITPQGKSAPHGAILKIVTTNICGSDLHIYRGSFAVPKGMTMGHEMTGEVIEVGSDVEVVKKGDIVSVPFNVGCGRCYNCKHMRSDVCENTNPEIDCGAYGFNLGGWTGGQGDYLFVPYADFNLLRFPDCYGSGYLSLGGGCLSRVRPGRFPELQREHRAMRRT